MTLNQQSYKTWNLGENCSADVLRMTWIPHLSLPLSFLPHSLSSHL